MPTSNDSYSKQLLAVAPMFAVKTLADIPKAAVESAVEGKLRDRSKKFSKLLTHGFKGRGIGRALGGTAAIASAPLFVRGVHRASSKEKHRRNKGLRDILAASTFTGIATGGVEGFREARLHGLSRKAAAKEGLGFGASRALVKSPKAIALALGVAAGRKKKRSRDKYLVPATVGAALGGASRYAEQVLRHAPKGVNRKLFKAALPRGAGGVVGGALGGLGLAAVTDRALKALDKGKQKRAAAGVLSKVASAAAEKLGPKRTAVFIQGNPRWRTGHEARTATFYKKVVGLLEGEGFEVTTDPGLPYTSPKKADVWVGYSRGVDRLRFAPKGTTTIALGSNVAGAVRHPKDNTANMVGTAKGVAPNKYHYVLTPRMVGQLKRKLTGVAGRSGGWVQGYRRKDGTRVKAHRRRVAVKGMAKVAAAAAENLGTQHGTGIPAMKSWFKPYPHQASAVRKMYDNHGKMILAHGTGTGKTASAIYGFEKLRHDKKAKKALVVVPSGLRMNFAENGIQNFTTSSVQIVGSASEKKYSSLVVRPNEVDATKDYTIVSYATFRRDPERYMQATGSDTLILDEFHKARNEKALTFQALMKARAFAVNVMGLTASPINNNPQELATLLTITEGKRLVSPAQFKAAFTKTIGHSKGFQGGTKKVTDLDNIPEMLRLTYPRMDLITSEDLKGKTMPRQELQTVQVPMSEDQYDLYELALDKLGPLKKYLMTRDKEVTVREAQQLFGKLIQARQIANSVHTAKSNVSPKKSAEITPKVKKLIEDAESHLQADSTHKVVLYSNLVKGGVDVMSAGLKARGIDHALFVGKGRDVGNVKVTGPVRQQGVKDYKAGKKRVIILSGAGAEGLDLKNSTAFYSLDAHFNPEVTAQAEARARRLGGQDFRKPENRVVDVRRYQSVVPDNKKPGFFGKLIGRQAPQTTDEWVSSVADNKLRKTKTFKRVMREPHKYIKKYRAANGKMRYVYPKGGKAAPAKKRAWYEFYKSAPEYSPSPRAEKLPALPQGPSQRAMGLSKPRKKKKWYQFWKKPESVGGGTKRPPKPSVIPGEAASGNFPSVQPIPSPPA
jgi:hypothetical protein